METTLKKRILIVEDDEGMAQVLQHNLRLEGFEVEWIADGDSAIRVARGFAPDLVLLDLTLRGKSGLDLAAVWRHQHNFSIIMLTAKDRKEDKLRGLQGGADDYITKPFDLDELLARIHAILRRTRPSLESIELGSVTIDFQHFSARWGSRSLELTRREFDLLRYLAERPNATVYRDELLREVWGFQGDPYTRAVDKAVSRLRTKIEPDPQDPKFLLTVHGIGYSLSPRPRALPSASSGITEQSSPSANEHSSA
jgi:DNA-binding response OmpR family regulator